jgi:hypothetical protein
MLGYIMSALIDLFIERQYKAKKETYGEKKTTVALSFSSSSFLQI